MSMTSGVSAGAGVGAGAGAAGIVRAGGVGEGGGVAARSGVRHPRTRSTDAPLHHAGQRKGSGAVPKVPKLGLSAGVGSSAVNGSSRLSSRSRSGSMSTPRQRLAAALAMDQSVAAQVRWVGAKTTRDAWPIDQGAQLCA